MCVKGTESKKIHIKATNALGEKNEKKKKKKKEKAKTMFLVWESILLSAKSMLIIEFISNSGSERFKIRGKQKDNFNYICMCMCIYIYIYIYIYIWEREREIFRISAHFKTQQSE